MGGRRLTLEDRKKIEDRWLAGDGIRTLWATPAAHRPGTRTPGRTVDMPLFSLTSSQTMSCSS